jgi:hypothetical protein
MIVFTGQMEKTGHLMQPMARATGQMVITRFSKEMQVDRRFAAAKPH